MSRHAYAQRDSPPSHTLLDQNLDPHVDGPKQISVFLIFICVVLLGCLLLGILQICTYQSNDDDNIISTTLHQYRHDIEELQSWVSIRFSSNTVSSQRYNVIPISITLA